MNITNYKEINRGSLIAAFDLALPSGMVIHGAMLMESSGSKWISFPGIPYDLAGKKMYRPVVDIPDRDRRDRFNALVLEALEEQS